MTTLFESKCTFFNTCLTLGVVFHLSLYNNDVRCSFLRPPRSGATRGFNELSAFLSSSKSMVALGLSNCSSVSGGVIFFRRGNFACI